MDILSLSIGLVVGALALFFVMYFKNKGVAEKLHSIDKEAKDVKLDLTEKRQELQGVMNQLSAANSKIELISEDKNLLKNELEHKRKQNETIGAELAATEQNNLNLNQKLQEQQLAMEKLQEKFTKEFENLANKILDEKSAKFSEQNKEQLQHILNPLKEKIQTFEQKVETSHKERIDMHASLRQQILGLRELNESIGKEALNLTKALKGDAKKQGNWGELVLDRVLEKSGLEEGREYEKQASLKTEEGRNVFPDVVIHLPQNKKMIVDSKVSLVAYERYASSEDKDEQVKYLKEHIASMAKHIDDLSGKNYHELYQIESPDFVLLFVPIEPAFAVALNEDNALYNKAFDKNIVIVTPTTLLATLRTIDSMWNNDKQQRNALEIAKQAGRLYDQFVNLLDDLKKVGNQFRTAQGSYETAMKKFTGKGNVFTKIEKLNQLGAKANKAIPKEWLDKLDE